MSGATIISEVHAALIEAGEAVGNGEHIATLETKGAPTGPEWNQTPGAVDRTGQLTIIEDWQEQKDRNGTVIGAVRHMLIVSAAGPVPNEGDRVAVGVAPADAADDSPWAQIVSVRPESQAGVALMYHVEIDR